MKVQPETVKEVLEIIDAFLMRDDHESRDLWRILTALRGPDNDDERLKKTTTAVIRSKAFPRCHNKFSQGGAFYSVNGAIFAKREQLEAGVDHTILGSIENGGWHFASHIESAESALNKI